MARSVRQSKILELISTKEVETQDDLVSFLRASGFDITQATISRDIKELGLIKVMATGGKYKYAVVNSGEQGVTTKNISIFKELVISVNVAQNLCVLKTIRGMASGINSLVDKLNLEDVMGSVYGEDTVMIIFPNIMLAANAKNVLSDMLN